MFCPEFILPETKEKIASSQRARYARIREAVELQTRAERVGFAVVRPSSALAADVERVAQLAKEYRDLPDASARIADQLGLRVRTVRKYRKISGTRLGAK